MCLCEVSKSQLATHILMVVTTASDTSNVERKRRGELFENVSPVTGVELQEDFVRMQAF